MGLGCYVCTSFNGTNELCEDEFNTVEQESFDFYNERCMGYRKDRAGYFPADHCVKIKGNSSPPPSSSWQGRNGGVVPAADPTYSIMIRTCSVDSGSMTSDTEVGLLLSSSLLTWGRAADCPHQPLRPLHVQQPLLLRLRPELPLGRLQRGPGRCTRHRRRLRRSRRPPLAR